MLRTIVIILAILWILGLITSVGGPIIHLLLVIAVVIVVINLVQGKRIF
ncbi:MAG: lmo0937 family membrane protein [Erysipelothrix sp.]|jgi:hypothetical protein|nr:lmo0937 family membrane protein [Erysipelothrix sp.]